MLSYRHREISTMPSNSSQLAKCHSHKTLHGRTRRLRAPALDIIKALVVACQPCKANLS